LAALRRMTDRHRQHGRWGLDGEGMRAIAEGLEVYEEILSNSSPAQMQRAVDQRMRVLRMQAA
jgi:oligoribonuclease NrnB/cAMP/cGMP phosphodiesterase (DHH superfamily)